MRKVLYRLPVSSRNEPSRFDYGDYNFSVPRSIEVGPISQGESEEIHSHARNSVVGTLPEVGVGYAFREVQFLLCLPPIATGYMSIRMRATKHLNPSNQVWVDLGELVSAALAVRYVQVSAQLVSPTDNITHIAAPVSNPPMWA